jgi:hypothetical protein
MTRHPSLVTTYLWLHVGTLQAELSTLARSRLVIESELRAFVPSGHRG